MVHRFALQPFLLPRTARAFPSWPTANRDPGANSWTRDVPNPNKPFRTHCSFTLHGDTPDLASASVESQVQCRKLAWGPWSRFSFRPGGRPKLQVSISCGLNKCASWGRHAAVTRRRKGGHRASSRGYLNPTRRSLLGFQWLLRRRCPNPHDAC